MPKSTIKKPSIILNGNGIGNHPTGNRLEVLKTYKIYIGGQFPRTESGRYYIATNGKGEKLANVCLSSRKDFRDAIVSNRAAFGAGPVELPLTAAKFYTVLPKCWKAEKRSSSMK